MNVMPEGSTSKTSPEEVEKGKKIEAEKQKENAEKTQRLIHCFLPLPEP